MGRAEVRPANGGWIVTEPDSKGRPLYVGKDGYWTRISQAASPWKTREEAEATVIDLNNKPSRKD